MKEWKDGQTKMGRSHEYVWNASHFHSVDPATTDSLMGKLSRKTTFLPDVPYKNISLGRSMRKPLPAYADSKGPDQPAQGLHWSGPSLSANKIIRYCRMYQWRAKTRMVPVPTQDDLTLRTLRTFEGTFSLDVVHPVFHLVGTASLLLCIYNLLSTLNLWRY